MCACVLCSVLSDVNRGITRTEKSVLIRRAVELERSSQISGWGVSGLEVVISVVCLTNALGIALFLFFFFF